jgi:hypothetical protein
MTVIINKELVSVTTSDGSVLDYPLPLGASQEFVEDAVSTLRRYVEHPEEYKTV